MRALFLTICSGLFLLSCRTASANGQLLTAANPEADSPVGIGMSFLRLAAASFPRYAEACIASPSCRLSAQEQADLKQAMAAFAQHPVAVDAAAPGDPMPSGDAVTAWSAGRLLADEGRLSSKDFLGRAEPLSIFRGVAEVVARLFEHVPGADAASGVLVGGKLSTWLYEHAEIARIGSKRILTSINLGDRNQGTQVYAADANRVTDLSGALATAFTCDDGSVPTGLSIWSLRWTHGVPGAIFRQPAEGRLNIYCGNGKDRMGNDVLIEMFFAHEVMTAQAPIISEMPCSKGGCYPHIDTSPGGNGPPAQN